MAENSPPAGEDLRRKRNTNKDTRRLTSAASSGVSSGASSALVTGAGSTGTECESLISACQANLSSDRAVRTRVEPTVRNPTVHRSKGKPKDSGSRRHKGAKEQRVNKRLQQNSRTKSTQEKVCHYPVILDKFTLTNYQTGTKKEKTGTTAKRFVMAR